MILFCRGGGRYTIHFLHCRGVSPFSFGCYRSSLISVCLVWKTHSVTMSSGQWFEVSTLGCIFWTLPSVLKGWSLWTPSWNWQCSTLLLARILFPFPIVPPTGQGVPQGRRSPSFLWNFPRGLFHLFLRSLKKGVGAWWVQIGGELIKTVPS